MSRLHQVSPGSDACFSISDAAAGDCAGATSRRRSFQSEPRAALRQTAQVANSGAARSHNQWQGRTRRAANGQDSHTPRTGQSFVMDARTDVGARGRRAGLTGRQPQSCAGTVFSAWFPGTQSAYLSQATSSGVCASHQFSADIHAPDFQQGSSEFVLSSDNSCGAAGHVYVSRGGPTCSQRMTKRAFCSYSVTKYSLWPHCLQHDTRGMQGYPEPSRAHRWVGRCAEARFVLDPWGQRTREASVVTSGHSVPEACVCECVCVCMCVSVLDSAAFPLSLQSGGWWRSLHKNSFLFFF